MTDFKALFPIFQQPERRKPLCYLDSAATAQKPQVVLDAMNDFYLHHYGTVHRAVYELSIFATDKFHEARMKVKAFIKARDFSEIIFTKGTTESINLVARSFGDTFVGPGDEIIVTGMEHHSNIVPWQMLCERKGARLIVVPFDKEGHIDLEAYQSLLSKKTKIVAFPHVSNSLGTINPVAEMTALAHAGGAKVLLDAAQSAPHLPIDVEAMDVDFLAFSGHKVYGPTGIGVLYGKRELLDQMPPFLGGGDMIETVTFEKSAYAPLPQKFEAGTPMIAEAIGLGAAIDFINGIGFEVIGRHEKELTALLYSSLKKIPQLTILGGDTPRSSLATFFVPGAHSLDIATLLDLKGIAIRSGHLCAQPVMRHFGISQAARASCGIYTTCDDILYFVSSLEEVLWKLQKK